MNIVCGFNGVIIPFLPYLPYSGFYSSDIILVDYLRTNNYLSFRKKILASYMVRSDRRTRVHLGSFIKGQPSLVLENVSKIISTKISEEVLDVLSKLKGEGFELYVVSCNADLLINNSLFLRNESCRLFKSIIGNHVSVCGGGVVDYECVFKKGRDKVRFLEESLHLKPDDTIVVGASRDDIPLLEWSKYPILIDASRDGWKRYEKKNFIFMESVSMLPAIIRSLI